MTQYQTGQTLLKFDHVNFEYDGKPILNDIDFEIKKIIHSGVAAGQVYSLLGPSGCGKTTALRLIAGLLTPTKGRVTAGGSSEPVHAGQVGVVAQTYPLFAHRTVLSNLMLAAQQKEHEEARAKIKVWELLHEFDLEERAHLYPYQLSGGQRQRAAILQQVLCSDHLIVMDEPFSGLDLMMQEKTCALISKVANMDDFNTVVIVTHDVTTAASISDHLLLMKRFSDGAKIVKTYDLIAEGLCYTPGICTKPELVEFVRGVKQEFRNL
jgi:polar amino acid transport system ATP-binding protein/sulfate transport system ATP-binding protein